MTLNEISVRPIESHEIERYDELMQTHHYLGAARPIGESLRYVALWHHQWVALLGFSSAALKCAPRDQWIGWSYHHQFDRLHLLTNNSRFLILPQWHYPNLASRVLSLCQRRIARDWQAVFDHPLLLLETFVDPARFPGTLYRATNWQPLGLTKGYRRMGDRYQPDSSPKRIFVYPLQRHARRLLSQPILNPIYQHGATHRMLTADQMRTLPDLFRTLPDPRRSQGQRHRLSTILAIATAAILCGRVGYKGIAQWAQALSQDARARFNCRYHQGHYHVPSLSAIRHVLIGLSPDMLDQALNQWNAQHAQHDKSLAIDGKTMRSAYDEDGKQTHIMSAIGHDSLTCYTQKKSAKSTVTMTQ